MSIVKTELAKFLKKEDVTKVLEVIKKIPIEITEITNTKVDIIDEKIIVTVNNPQINEIKKTSIKTLIEVAMLAQSNGILSLDDASLVKQSIDFLKAQKVV